MPRKKMTKTNKNIYQNDGKCPICSNIYKGMTTKGFAHHVRSSHPKMYDAGRKVFKSQPVYMWDFANAELMASVDGAIDNEIRAELKREALAVKLPKLPSSLSDSVNHPPHYTNGSIECIEAIKAALTPEEFRGFLKGNALKYIWREKLKNGVEDIKKSLWYISKLSESELTTIGNTSGNTDNS